jgi:hypothetical protein
MGQSAMDFEEKIRVTAADIAIFYINILHCYESWKSAAKCEVIFARALR